jgi:hypothetical protein
MPVNRGNSDVLFEFSLSSVLVVSDPDEKTPRYPLDEQLDFWRNWAWELCGPWIVDWWKSEGV